MSLGGLITLFTRWLDRHGLRERARRQLEQIRADVTQGERIAHTYCAQAKRVKNKLQPMPSYRIPVSGNGLVSGLHAEGRLTDKERECVADWYEWAEQMNRAMDNKLTVVALQKALHLTQREVNGYSRAELARGAIAASITRIIQ